MKKITKVEKKILIGGVATVALSLSVIGIGQVSFSKAYASDEKEVVYEYALLGDTYRPIKGFLGGKTPKGEPIGKDTESVFLNWASGTYTFEYASRTVNVRVYEKAPKDDVVYSVDMPSDICIGTEVEFPHVVITSNIYRTDGAPKIGEYGYQLYIVGENGTVCNFNSEDEFVYTFENSGSYTLQYRYENVFGKQCSIEKTFTVSETKTVMGIPKKASVGDKIDLSNVYGTYQKERFPVSVSVKYPSGKEEIPTDAIIFKEKGICEITVNCAYGTTETVTKKINVDVSTDLNSFVTNKSSLTAVGETSVFKNIQGNIDKAGYLYKTGSNSSFYYNGVIDLRKFGKNDSLIDVLPNVETGKGVTAVSFTLIDVYDANNTVSVTFTRNSDFTAPGQGTNDNSLVKVSYGSVSTAINNFYPLVDSAVGWNTSFHNLWFSQSESTKARNTLNFSYDLATNTVSAYGDYHKVNWPNGSESANQKRYDILNLSDPSLPIPFKGFTTGEVYLKVTTTGSGDVQILNIGGKSASALLETDFQNNSGILLGKTDFTLHGIKGKEYPFEQAVLSSFMQKNSLKVTVKGTDGTEETLTDGKWIPQTAGTYKVNYFAVNEFGFAVEKEFTVEIQENATPITVAYDTPTLVKAGALYTVKEAVIFGGHGNVDYTMKLNGKDVQVGETVKLGDGFELVITATDALGNQRVKTFTANVDKNTFDISVEFPRSAVCGSAFTIPTAKIYSYAQGKFVDYTVKFNGVETSEKTITLSNTGVQTVEYKVGEKVFSYSLNVIEDCKEVADISKVLSFTGTGRILSSVGTEFTLTGDGTIAFPYAVSSNELNLVFLIRQKDLNYDKVVFTLTGKDGTKLTIAIDDLLKDYPTLYVNGIYTGKTLNKTKSVGGSRYPEGYKGEELYTFSLKYDDCYCGILSGTKPLFKISTDADGKAFSGFKGGVFVDVKTDEWNTGVTASIINLLEISNQSMSSGAFDSVAPEIYGDGCINGKIVEYNAELNITSAKAFDVLSSGATIKATLTAPNGNKIYENVNPADTTAVRFDQYGVYQLTFTLTDVHGQQTKKTVNYMVEDTTPPTLTVNGLKDIETKAGETVKLFSATASDNVSNVKISVIVYTPNGAVEVIANNLETVENLSYKFTRTGNYTVRYTVRDASGNVASQSFRVKVK